MDADLIEDDYDRERRMRRQRHMEEMRREKRRQMVLRRLFALLILATVVAGVLIFTSLQVNSILSGKKSNEDSSFVTVDIERIEDIDAPEEEIAEPEETKTVFNPQVNDKTKQPSAEVVSQNVILIDEDEQSVLVQKNASAIICPASMTKVLTLLVAAENIQNLEDKFTITIDITDYSFVHDCSNVGFSKDETVTIKDLLYGTILPSGADAAVGLATYVAGSQEAFVEMMNDKLKELGLSDTAHFTNCVGIYDKEHYCTVYDMAIIMKAAIDNDLCREILSTHTYTTSKTTQHPEGITISNWFLRRIEDKDSGGEVLCGKTGYVVQSGSCAVSYAQDDNQKGYICVTADSNSSWRCIYDQVALYHDIMAKQDASE